jgi:transcriptional regulator with XRE-family HTH domain
VRRLHPIVADLAARLAAQEVTQRELAERIGVHQNTVSRWFTGSKVPALGSLCALAAALGCEIRVADAERPGRGRVRR